MAEVTWYTMLSKFKPWKLVKSLATLLAIAVELREAKKASGKDTPEFVKDKLLNPEPKRYPANGEDDS